MSPFQNGTNCRLSKWDELSPFKMGRIVALRFMGELINLEESTNTLANGELGGITMITMTKYTRFMSPLGKDYLLKKTQLYVWQLHEKNKKSQTKLPQHIFFFGMF